MSANSSNAFYLRKTLMTASRAGIWIMKHIGSNIAALVILLISAGPLLAQEDPQFRILADGDLPVRNCTFCHGPSGQGFMVAPRLAGQRPQYIVNNSATSSGISATIPLPRNTCGTPPRISRPTGRTDLQPISQASRRGPPTMAIETWRRSGRDLRTGNTHRKRGGLHCLPWPERPRGAGNPAAGRAVLCICEATA